MLFSKIQKLGRGKNYISMLIIVKTDFSRDNSLIGKNILLGKSQVQAPIIV